MTGAVRPDAPEDSAALADERLVLAACRTLFENGEDTSGVFDAARMMSRALGRPMRVTPAWGEIGLHAGERLALTASAVPWNVNMRRVAATLAAIEGLAAKRSTRREAVDAVAEAARLRPYNPWLFASMCGIGAPALGVINGATNSPVLAVVGIAAFLGGLLRRWMGTGLGIDNGLPQLFAAALLGGAAGGVAARLRVDFGSGLVMLGPLLVLVPGPAFMSGAFDLMSLRLPLGLARFTYGLLSITAIVAGALIGAGLTGGLTPDPQAPAAHLPLWQDMICAGVASAAYAVFFSMPWRMLAIPVVMGMLSHGLRWICLTDLHLTTASAAGLACLLVGVVLVPIARRRRLPFAAVGFASVVAQVPGIYLFRLGAGLVALQRLGAAAPRSLIGGIADDGATALLCLVTMALGLAIPESIYRRIGVRRSAVRRQDDPRSAK